MRTDDAVEAVSDVTRRADEHFNSEPIASLLQVKNYENQRKLTQPLKDGGAKQVRARDVVVSNPTYIYLLRRITLFLRFFFYIQ